MSGPPDDLILLVTKHRQRASSETKQLVQCSIRRTGSCACDVCHGRDRSSACGQLRGRFAAPLPATPRLFQFRGRRKGHARAALPFLTIRSSVVRNHVKKRLLRATNVSFLVSDGEEAATQKRKFDENEVFELATASFDIAVTPVLASTAWPRGAQNDFVLAAIAQNLRRLATLVARPPPALVLHNA